MANLDWKSHRKTQPKYIFVKKNRPRLMFENVEQHLKKTICQRKSSNIFSQIMYAARQASSTVANDHSSRLCIFIIFQPATADHQEASKDRMLLSKICFACRHNAIVNDGDSSTPYDCITHLVKIK